MLHRCSNSDASPLPRVLFQLTLNPSSYPPPYVYPLYVFSILFTMHEIVKSGKMKLTEKEKADITDADVDVS
jgi:hypothetical protein